MSDTFTEGFCLKLTGVLPPEQVRAVRDLLSVYTIGYKIEPVKMDVIVQDYQLPQAYFIFLAAKEQDGRMKPGTREQYRMCLEDLLFKLRLPLEDITVNHLRLYIQDASRNRKTGRPVSKNTLNQRKSIIRSFFSWLYEEEYIEKDPSVRIKPERADAKPRTAYQDTQVEALRRACDNLRDRAIVDLLRSSGIRVAECVGLDRRDVDLDGREVTVFGKGEKWRVSYIDAAAVVSIRAYLATRTDENEALFVSERAPHRRLSTSGVRKALHRLTPESGVQNVIPHRFRYTMATDALLAGMPVESVQSVLGHSRIETTMHYAHVCRAKVKTDYQRFAR